MEYHVITSSRSSGIGNGLSYSSKTLQPILGSAVEVPLRNKIVEGFVLSCTEDQLERTYDIKSLHTIVGDIPLLSKYHLQLIQWIAKKYCCTLRSAASLMLPTPPWTSLLPQDFKGYRLSQDSHHESVRGKKQIAVVEDLSHERWVSESSLRESTGASLSVLTTLVDKGILIEEVHREIIKKLPTPDIATPSLTVHQQAAVDAILSSSKPALLFGVTSSGKTEIYADLISRCIQEGKQAILLVPEILLTEHIIVRFLKLLPKESISIIHSRLTPAQRKKAWRDIHRGKIHLVIGSRSALFAPCQNLGVVIIDEEHEWTYKNEQTPRYHARDAAEALCLFSGSRLVLGTATPSLESWDRAKRNVYNLVRLDKRYKDYPYPIVRVIDLSTVVFGNAYPFSTPLIEAIEERLKRKEQSVLFLNRRGIGSALLCLDCKRRIVSPESLLPFTVHRNPSGKDYLMDHTTNAVVDIPDACPHCKSNRLFTVGAGTQRIEDILRTRFPTARVIRADKDTMSHPDQMRSLLSTMANNESDILLGTQSVVKGLDLPNVTLAAVLLADVGLSLPHFRAGERIFQLLTQLTGRSGRAKPGEVIIQTFRPDAPEVSYAAKHGTEEFLEAELALRIHAGYPPASSMVRILFRGIDAKRRAEELVTSARKINASSKLGIIIGCAPTLFGGGKIWHVLLRGSRPRDLLTKLDTSEAVVDIDPMDCL
ncbi:MAG: primosomal protein N' [bacterium]|nr:primosomal protein N' [bacterium]